MPEFPSYPLKDNLAHQADIMQALESVVQAGNYILGSEVSAFEKAFAAFIQSAQVIGVANGTDAIELMLRGLGIGAGDYVAVPSHTAVASVSAISRTGAKPLFIDVDAETATLCPASLEAALNAFNQGPVKAVLAVHLYGHPCDMKALQEVADKHGTALLEDVAQAHGAVYHGQFTGTMGLAGSFSFYPTKNLGAIGDGGAVATGNAELATRMQSIRQYGWVDRYISATEGINSRLDEMQAAILRVKLHTLPDQLANRRRLAGIYASRLQASKMVTTPVTREHCEHAYHLYVVRSAQRDALMKFLTSKGIPVALHYPAAVHQQPAYAKAERGASGLERTETWIQQILTLPLHPYLPEESVHHVCDMIEAFEATLV